MADPADAPHPPAAETPDPLAAIGAQIGEPDPLAAEAVVAALGGPAGAAGLGRLGELARWWAAVRGVSGPGRADPVLLAGGSPEVAARRPGAEVAPPPAPAGTEAGTGTEIDAAVAHGLALADDAAARGVELLVLSVDDPGATRALGADLLGLDPVEASGWPMDRGISDEQWMDEVAALRDRLRRLRGLRDRPVDLLRALDAPATAAAVGVLVQATAHRIPTMLDGPGASAVALLARRTRYAATAWWQAAQATDDMVHQRALGSLGLEPLTQLGITVEDGTAALTGLALLDEAAAILAALPPPASVTAEIDPL